MKALSVLVLAATFAPALQRPEEPTPAPRQPINASPGVRTRSLVVLGDGSKFELEATYAFPDRARWLVSIGEGNARSRRIDYRMGQRAFRIPEGSAQSRELEPLERAELFLAFELRRALYVFPHGFDWRPDGALQRCDLANLGTLWVARDEHARPRELWSTDPGGKERERVRVLSWRRRLGTDVLHELELLRGERPYGKETIERFYPDADFVDAHFMPLDRREVPLETQTTRRVLAPLKVELGDQIVRRVELPAGTDWDAAWKRADALWTETRDELSGSDLTLADARAVELSNTGTPAACWVRLAEPGESVPEGWTRLRGGRGRSARLAEPQARSATTLLELAALVPPATRAGPAWLSTSPAHAEGFQWVLLEK